MDRVLGSSSTPNFQQYQQLQYIMRCVNESMRLYPHPPVLLRRARVPDVLPGGYNVVKGQDVMISVYNIHHSPEVNGGLYEGQHGLYCHCTARHRHCQTSTICQRLRCELQLSMVCCSRKPVLRGLSWRATAIWYKNKTARLVLCLAGALLLCCTAADIMCCTADVLPLYCPRTTNVLPPCCTGMG